MNTHALIAKDKGEERLCVVGLGGMEVRNQE